MSIPTDCKTCVKYDLYGPHRNSDDWNEKINIGSIETSSQEAIKNLSSPEYIFKKDQVFYELVDLKEVIVDGCSYKVTAGRCSGAVAIERIEKTVKDHFKKI